MNVETQTPDTIRKSGRIRKMWSGMDRLFRKYEYAEREDGQMFFRHSPNQTLGVRRTGWVKCLDPRRSDGTISGGFMADPELITTGLGRMRLPK